MCCHEIGGGGADLGSTLPGTENFPDGFLAKPRVAIPTTPLAAPVTGREGELTADAEGPRSGDVVASAA